MKRKTAMSALDLAALVRDLDGLVGAFLDKVYEPRPGLLLLRFRGGGREPGAAPRLDLAVAPGRFAFPTKTTPENPPEPSGFATQLRRFAAGSRVLAVRQVGFDRILTLTLRREGEEFLLVVELFGDGNVVLVRDGMIAAVKTPERHAHRDLLVGRPWTLPPPRIDPLSATETEIQKALAVSKADLVRTLATDVNLGPALAEEVCALAAIPKATKAASLPPEAASGLLEAIRTVRRRLDAREFAPLVVAGPDGAPVDVAPWPLAPHAGLATTAYPSLGEALAAYFSLEDEATEADPEVAAATAEVERLERQAAHQREALVRLAEEEREAKAQGDLLYAHYGSVERILGAIRGMLGEHGWGGLEKALAALREPAASPLSHVVAVDAAAHRVTIALADPGGEPRRVVLDPMVDIPQNAGALYGLAKEMRGKHQRAEAALQDSLALATKARAEGDRRLRALARTKERPKPTKRFWFDRYRWFLSSEGNLVIGGRDAKSNETLVKRHLEPNDRYVHADVQGAPSVVVKALPAGIGEATLEEACGFAASYSKAWSVGAMSGEAYWVTPAQVSKTPESGEYLAKGAFVIRGKRTYASVPLRIAIGEIEHEGAKKIMGGPPRAIEARSSRFVVLEPGDEAGNALAPKLARAFNVPVEDVQATIPPGGVRVVETKGVSL
ncbi:MAG: ribosome rescue protein RqcH [Methanobacteriota archaeon]